MGVRATELRKGSVLDKDGDLLLITEYKHHTPGNLRAIIQIKTKSLKSGQANQFRLSSNDVLEVAFLDKKNCQYLYREQGGPYVFMDEETYEQVRLDHDLVADQMGYVRENTTVVVTFHEHTPVSLELPATVVLTVAEAEPAVKGNTTSNVKKEVTLETGLVVKVPAHIAAGEEIKIRTADGEFQGRAGS